MQHAGATRKDARALPNSFAPTSSLGPPRAPPPFPAPHQERVAQLEMERQGAALAVMEHQSKEVNDSSKQPSASIDQQDPLQALRQAQDDAGNVPVATRTTDYSRDAGLSEQAVVLAMREAMSELNPDALVVSNNYEIISDEVKHMMQCVLCGVWWWGGLIPRGRGAGAPRSWEACGRSSTAAGGGV